MNASTFFRTGLLALVSLFLLASVVFAGDYKNGGKLVNKATKTFEVKSGNFLNYNTAAGTVENAGTINVNTLATQNFVNDNGALLHGTVTNNIVAANGTINVGQDFINVAGTVTNPGTIDANRDVTSTTGMFGNTGTIKVFRNLSASSNFTTSGGTVEYDGTGPQSVLGITYGTLRALNASTKTMANDVTASTLFEVGGTATLDVSTHTLTLAGTVTTGGTLTASAGKVEYTLAGAQNVFATTYKNLTLSGSGDKTSAGAVTLAGTFSNAVAGINFVMTNLNIDASADVTGNTGTIKPSGTVVVTDGTSETIGGTFDYTGATQTVVSAQYTNLTLSGTGGTVTINSTPYIFGSFAPTGGSTHNYAGSTIRFNGAGSQSIAGDVASFAALEFYDAGVKTLTSNVTTTGAVTINSTTSVGDGVVVSNGVTLTVGGDLTNDGTLTNNGTITVN